MIKSFNVKLKSYFLKSKYAMESFTRGILFHKTTYVGVH